MGNALWKTSSPTREPWMVYHHHYKRNQYTAPVRSPCAPCSTLAPLPLHEHCRTRRRMRVLRRPHRLPRHSPPQQPAAHPRAHAATRAASPSPLTVRARCSSTRPRTCTWATHLAAPHGTATLPGCPRTRRAQLAPHLHVPDDGLDALATATRRVATLGAGRAPLKPRQICRTATDAALPSTTSPPPFRGYIRRSSASPSPHNSGRHHQRPPLLP